MWRYIIPAVAVLIIVGGAIMYILRAKKKGKKCIGCPYSCSCDKRSCSSTNEK